MLTFRHLEGRAGRLGNQLWEIAGTLGLARARRTQPRFPKWSYQPFFSVPDEFFVDDPQGVDAAELPTHIDPRARMYMQDYGLWRDVEEEVRDYFRPSNLARNRLAEQAGFLTLTKPILSVHVRRGDNVQANDPGTPNKHLYHPLRPMSYYQAAFAEAAVFDAASVAVFSDDPDWAQENIHGSYYHRGVVRPKEHLPEYHTEPILDWIDFFLMAQCDYHIISNSTYAWWAAFLSGDPHPIYPMPWFGPILHYIDADLMFPPDWIRINHGAA